MRRVLVTAGAGSIGKAVVRKLLADQFEVVVLDTRPLPASLPSVRQVLARSTDPEAVADAVDRCDHIIHLEWSGSVHRTTLEPVQTNRHNTEATLLVLEAAKRLRIPMTFASTCVYRGESARPMREGDAINERSLYVAQKLYAESCLKAYASMFGLSACSLRVFNVYGTDGAPFQILPRIKEALRTGTPITLTGDGGQVRDFIHSEDVAAAFCRSIGKTFQGEAFNVGTGTGTSMLELIQMAMAVTGNQIPIEFTPAKGEEARFLIADTRQAALSLGFQTSITLEQGLEHILN